jgi:hypothetical protein
VAAILASEYGITPRGGDARQYAPGQLDALLGKVSTLNFRRDYMLASLMVLIGNALGGKADPNDPKAKKIDPARVYSVTDFLPPWSRPEGFLAQAGGTRVPREVAREFLEASKRAQLPAWVIAVAPLAAIRQSAA